MEHHYPYLILGGGMAAAAAVQGIREHDPARAIGLIAAECDPPYRRPPLTKGLWKGDPRPDEIGFDLSGPGLDLHLGRTALTLDTRNRAVVDDTGTAYTFDKLLLATGGTPRRLPIGEDHILYFRTLADYRRLRALAAPGRRFAVVGGGFIGAELAAALTMFGVEVVLIFPGTAIGDRVYPADLARFLNGYYREKGVDVRPGQTLTRVEARGDQVALGLAGGAEIVVDGVVAGLGLTPNDDLAQRAGLAVQNGVLVDAYLRTSAPNVYAAGDVAVFPDAVLGERRRVEHEDNATAMGRAAGQNMAGAAAPYQHLPFFYSDLFDLGYEAVGALDARLETFADWREPYREGVVYYLREGRVRGVLLWNVWDQVAAARELVAQPGPFTASDLQDRLPVLR